MKSDAIRSILVVCTGNICRSPMAEGVLRERLKSAGMDHIRVASTGTNGWDAEPPTPQAVLACKEIRVDIAGLRSSLCTREMVESADLILAMEQGHLDAIRKWFQPEDAKLSLLGDYHPETPGMEIPDPYGRSVRYYRNILDLIRRCADGILQDLAS